MAQSKWNIKAEHQILGIIKHEWERAFWHWLNLALAKKLGRSITRVQVVERDGSVRESATKREVESTLFGEIHGKRFYLAEQAPLCKGRMQGEFGYMANTTAGRAVLSGKYHFSSVNDIGPRELLKEVACLCQIMPANSVDLQVHHTKW